MADTATTATATASDDEFQPLPSNGQETVLAVDFDRYGTRMVTGSADHRLRVFDLNEKTKEWKLVEAWRGHLAHVIDVKFHPMLSRPGFLASIGADVRLKLWYENTLEASRSGRRFKCVYSQSPSHGVVYASIDFACPPSLTSPINPYSTILAAVTRDGLLSLLEPVEVPIGGADPMVPGSAAGSVRRIAIPGGLNEWREVDQVWMVNDRGVSRGTETCFKLAFQKGDPAGMGAGPSFAAVDAGLDARALTLAVTSLEFVNVFRLLGQGLDGDGPYQFQRPVAEITGPSELVRDVAWAPPSWRPRDRLATASADGIVRIYELWVPEAEQSKSAPPKAGANGGSGGNGPTARAPSGISAGLANVARSSAEGRHRGGQVRHKWELVSELKQPGVWKVAWIREGSMLVSTADSGKALIWSQAYEGPWKEFAEFGPDGDPGIRART